MVHLASTVLAAICLLYFSEAARSAGQRHAMARASDFTPANGSTIVPGSSFPFAYQPTDFCHGCFSPISVYLSVSPPTSANITSSGELADGAFISFFGDYDIPNCGFPLPGGNPPPPPSEFATPTLDVAEGTTLYFSVVETYLQCPPIGQTEFGLATVSVIYG